MFFSFYNPYEVVKGKIYHKLNDKNMCIFMFYDNCKNLIIQFFQILLFGKLSALGHYKKHIKRLDYFLVEFQKYIT